MSIDHGKWKKAAKQKSKCLKISNMCNVIDFFNTLKYTHICYPSFMSRWI